MSERVGFFTRTDAKSAAYKKKKNPEKLPTAVLHSMGPKAVARMNPRACTPEMPPILPKGQCDVYVLGESPGETDDERGKPWSSQSGSMLKAALSGSAALDNIVRTLPPGNRKPKPHEVEAFRKVVEADIAAAKPKIVIAAGGAAVAWCLPKLPSGSRAKLNRGRLFPAVIGGHSVWVGASLHPSYIIGLGNKRDEKIPAKEWHAIFRKDIARFEKTAKKLGPPQIPDLSNIEDLVVSVRTEAQVTDMIRWMRTKLKGRRVGLDFETTELRPYRKGARVLSFSVGTGYEARSVLLSHPDEPWPRAIRKRLRKALRDVLANATTVLAQNAQFEAEWLISLFGIEFVRGLRFDDPQVQAYLLDQRTGGHNLDYLCQYRLGVPVKSITGVDRKKIVDAPIDRLLPYNGLDVIYADRLYEAQDREIKRSKLKGVYDFHITRIPTLAIAQAVGMPISQDERKRLSKKFGKKLKAGESELRRTRGVGLYEKKFGRYLPGSSAANIVLFRDILKRGEGKDPRSKSYSADESALSQMSDCREAKLLLDYRGLAKCKSTYIDRFDPDHPESYVYPDGLVHCNFSHTRTKSTRLASSDPNNQNWPKRSKLQKVVRRQVQAPPGFTLVSADFGQIEARAIGMHSQDKAFCEALWNDYDIHQEWAEKAAHLSPRSFEKHARGDMSTYRSVIKNTLVFPAFYLSSPESIDRSLDLGRRATSQLFGEFWETFKGVKRWQKALIREYTQTGYVTSLMGRRHYGPMSDNVAVNLPIQGLACDIVVDAMDRLSYRAVEEGKPWLQPFLNIHDDLTFCTPDERLEDSIVTIAEEMTRKRFDFITVPLSVEVEVGTNWLEMVKIGTFTSED